jgi:3-dehydroquinate synthetase
MMAAVLYGHETGVTPAADAARIVALVRRMGRLPKWPRVAPKKLMELMVSDKKTRSGKLRFVLTPGIGKAATYEARDLHKLELVLRVTERLAEAEPVPHG